MRRVNIDWIAGLPAPVRVGAYFGLQRVIGARIRAAWEDVCAWTRLPPAELEEAVERRLSGLLDSAVSHVEHYRSLGLRRRPGESARDFLARFPVLTRTGVREGFAALVADPLRPMISSPDAVPSGRYDWLVIKSGGTTGTPIAVVYDRAFRDAARAGRVLSQQLCGFPLGTRYFRLWGSEDDLLLQAEQFDRRLLRNLLGEVPMNAFRTRDVDLAAHVETIRRHPDVHHMMAYVDAAVSLASYVTDHGLPAPAVRTIMACSGMVTPEWRRQLAGTFRAEVFDKYGSRECGDIACECTAHDGLHVFSPHVLVEVVDDAGRPCPPGDTGRILVTILANRGFPLVRYEIGDQAAWAPPGMCRCGLAFPRLARIDGRTDDMLTTEDGTRVSSVFVRYFVGVSLNRQRIREWQFEQVARGQFVFRFIPVTETGLAENLRALDERFRRVLGPSANVRFEQVAEIPPSATGKVRWIINRTVGTTR